MDNINYSYYTNEDGNADKNENKGEAGDVKSVKKTAEKIKLSGSKSLLLLLLALSMGCVYSACFTGINVLPKLSLPVFCAIAVLVLYYGLGKLEFLKNKKAFFWAVPIIIISLFNGVFELSLFHYFNVIVIHGMFALMAFGAVRENAFDYDDKNNWAELVMIIVSNWTITPLLIKGLDFNNKEKRFAVIMKVVYGILIGLPVLFIIFALMLGADAVFSSIVGNAFDNMAQSFGEAIGHIIAVVITLFYFSGYAYNLKYFKKYNIPDSRAKADGIISVTFLSMINLLFLFFCGLQVVYLFTGGYMTLPDGIVYSEYAREGFFQLLFITVINFSIMLVFIKGFPEAVKNKAVRILLILLCVFTGILICSSFYRMSLYISVYNYTALRIMVLTFLTMESLLIITTLLYLFNLKIKLVKSYVYICILFYAAANILASDVFLADLNFGRYYAGQTNIIDLSIYSGDIADKAIELYNFEMSKQTEDEKSQSIKHSIINKVSWSYGVYDADNQTLRLRKNKWQNMNYFKFANYNKAVTFLQEQGIDVQE